MRRVLFLFGVLICAPAYAAACLFSAPAFAAASLFSAPAFAAAVGIDDLLSSFNGNFDSKMQWDMEDHADLMERDRHPWTLIVHTWIQNSELGPSAFYVEELRDADPKKVVRQRVVSFAAEGDAVRMTQFTLKDAAKMRGAFRTPEKLSKLTANDLSPLPGCDVIWRNNEGEFWEGEIPGKACQVNAAGRARYVQYRVTLSYPLYQRVDRELYVDTDGLASGFPDELPTLHARVRYVP